MTTPTPDADGKVTLNSWRDAKRYAHKLHGGPVNDALDVVSYFAWWTALLVALDLLFCGAVAFRVPDLGQPAAATLAQTLAERGIRIRHREFRRGLINFNVPGAQARHASWLLDKLGLPHTHSPIPRRHRKGRRKGGGQARPGLLRRIKSELLN